MPKYKVYYDKRITICAEIEANSSEEADELAADNFNNYEWSQVNGSEHLENLYDTQLIKG